MDVIELINQNKTQGFVKQTDLKIDEQLFTAENALLNHAVDENPHEGVNANNELNQAAQNIKRRMLENFSNYKFIGDARLELSVNRSEGEKKSMGGTKRKFRSHVLGSDLRTKRLNMEAAVQLQENKEAVYQKFQSAAEQLNQKEFAQIFNALDLSGIDLSTDSKVIKAGPRMTQLSAMLRHNAILENPFISREKLELVKLLMEYYEVRMNLISDPEYATQYNSEIQVDEVSIYAYGTPFNAKIMRCREVALRLQEFRVAAKSEEAHRVERIDDALQKRFTPGAVHGADRMKEITFNEGDVYANTATVQEIAERVSHAEDTELNEIRDDIKDVYDNADDLYYLSIRKLNWANYRYNSITKDAYSPFLKYFDSFGKTDQSAEAQQGVLRKALNEGREYTKKVLPGGFDTPLSSMEQKDLHGKMQDILRIAGGKLQVPEGIAGNLETSENPYYKRFYSWVSKKDSVLFVHPPVAGDVKDMDKGIPNLRIALSSIAYSSANQIRDAIVDNQDGTVTVRFYEPNVDNLDEKIEVYVKVKKTLPELVGIGGKDQASLWVRLIEKAYAARYGAGRYDGAPDEMAVIMERLTFSHMDDIFYEDHTIYEIYNDALDDALSQNPEEVRRNMDQAVRECRKKYDTFYPTLVQVMEYATGQAFIKNEDRDYAEQYLLTRVGLNAELFSDKYTDAAMNVKQDFADKLRSGEVILVSCIRQEDGADKARKEALEDRGLHMNYSYQVLAVSQIDDGKHCIILRDPYMTSGTEYNKEKKPQKIGNTTLTQGCFAMELNDFMNCFNKVVV